MYTYATIAVSSCVKHRGLSLPSYLIRAGASNNSLFEQCRFKSSTANSGNGGGGGGKKSGAKSTNFRSRRQPDKNYRPLKIKTKKSRDPAPGNDHKFVDITSLPDPARINVDNSFYGMDKEFGPLYADAIRDYHREQALRKTGVDTIEEELRAMDYLGSTQGSLEDLAGERRANMPIYSTPDDEDVDMDEDYDGQLQDVHNFETHWFESSAPKEIDSAEAELGILLNKLRDNFGRNYNIDESPNTRIDPNAKAQGEWSEFLVTVDRTSKLWRGGRLYSYRAMVIGGNLNGCGGFGIGKSADANVAVEVASRLCRKNVFFVDRYQGNGITRDLAGKQNSCKVNIRATDLGLAGNELMREILKYFGIVNGRCKAYGNRNPFNVVRATFKALMTHESLEEISLKRGKRLMSMDRAKRMQV